jgi:[ribosomal protein S18]-alanine N-acetyltransferase
MNLVDFKQISAAQLQTVFAIEIACHLVPWSSFEAVQTMPQYWGRVLLSAVDGRVEGYSVCMPMGDEWELLNLSIDPIKQGIGLGSGLLHHSALLAQAAGAERMFLEVRQSNLAAIAVYEKIGFKVVGRRKQYYATRLPDQREDALIMALLFI